MSELETGGKVVGCYDTKEDAIQALHELVNRIGLEFVLDRVVPGHTASGTFFIRKIMILAIVYDIEYNIKYIVITHQEKG